MCLEIGGKKTWEDGDDGFVLHAMRRQVRGRGGGSECGAGVVCIGMLMFRGPASL